MWEKSYKISALFTCYLTAVVIDADNGYKLIIVAQVSSEADDKKGLSTQGIY
jgi:hypothetical protein